ncbi:unnamed protein product [Cuscuta epithymum]|uniref:Uncharacterized protein n=1 Tax=Cuscuta epithymum TaxID=186058 RepID=A0AAV0DP89_9ASTE|nr:unnamed protein product [Cuscuta epithymum]
MFSSPNRTILLLFKTYGLFNFILTHITFNSWSIHYSAHCLLSASYEPSSPLLHGLVSSSLQRSAFFFFSANQTGPLHAAYKSDFDRFVTDVAALAGEVVV